jgi:hypothetical protein
MGRNTKIHDTLATDTNDRSKTIYDESERRVFTMDVADTLKDGQEARDPKQI